MNNFKNEKIFDKDAKQNFNTKADILALLKRKIKKAEIEKLFFFTVEEWNSDPEKILKTISSSFNNKIIVRSSAIDEDSQNSSLAGSYESVLDVLPTNKKSTINAINRVINSYKIKNNFEIRNKILIQNQSKNIVTSGVIFSRTPDTGAPYFIINYDDSRITNSVTKGLVNRTIKIYRYCQKNYVPKKWRKLILSIFELEKILNSDILDVEFGIRKNQNIVIFQVRPLTGLSNQSFSYNDLRLQNRISKLEYDFIRSKNSPNEQISIFSDMADWNPSEIIGKNPNQLDYSIYDNLIMNYAWFKGRTVIGYKKPYSKNLMKKFGNKPYVNVTTSFSSFFPKQFSTSIEKKIMKYYLSKLQKYPYLHDKVEFEILFSCYDLTVTKRLKELKKYGFTNEEINNIEMELKQFTNTIFENFSKILKDSQNSIKELKTHREIIIENLENSNKTYVDYLDTAKILLEDCKKFGTIPFSTMARIAFISSIIIKSFVSKNILNVKDYNSILESIESPLTDFRKDFALFSNKKMTFKQFIKKYGHLRPGTYDITATRYDNEKFFEKYKFQPIQSHINKKINQKKIEQVLERQGLKIQYNDFIDLVKSSISERERLKFEFTKNLSESLEFIALSGEKLGFSRKDMANLDLSTIINSQKLSRKKLTEKWSSKIKQNAIHKEINNYLQLPPIISDIKDFFIVDYFVSKPNYISEKKITADIKIIKNLNNDDLKNKIVLIENADPGYDWIFTKNPLGLITKYGGVASHMAIRCSELGLPAAIGCGEMLFENLKKSKKIMLDCKNEQITILENETINEILEVKKTLRSLGYIK
ncbi:MAG: hypothetical protein K5782_02685 [Nitrosarchaeum sp.]|nr:hypothetical protein [Nitrosarchaeum sp.]